MLQIISILRKHIKAILGTTIIVGLMSAFATFYFMTPMYSATTEILVNRKLSAQMQGAQFQQVQADVQMISTYKDIINSPTVLKDVNREIRNYPGYPGSMIKLKKSISISTLKNSQVFSIKAVSTDPRTASETANLTADIFKHKIGKIMSINNVSIVSRAESNPKPVSPRKAINITLGLILGAMLGVAIAFIKELTDRTVDSATFITDELKSINLGIISEISQKEIERISKNKKITKQINRNKDSAVRRV
ncbi:chain-length determining protein [Companilactobacillus ginsenosidimutans]|uniref:Capsular polysaccharide biosynthesis protein CpsC n=2 Tax=Companilactobacillus ginsenosidimutans TaxID=1007676 RepID=A0A0H4R3T7_9LACO|nr:chain-length determining protein [Companilactobacillus ginsenosidimutans]